MSVLKIRVLLVEDNLEVGRFARQILEDFGYLPTWHTDAESALTEVERDTTPFDIVVSDVVMPGMGGVALAQELKRRRPKLPVLLEQLEDVLAEGHKALVFSSFTSYLRIVEQRLTAAGVRAAYLDGSTRDRDGAIRDFREGDSDVFLISLKAGGFGLNLTEADYVFLLDPWWNPAAEDQASDRAHRIGQTKSVFVYKLIAADTVEDRIVELQQRKTDLANIALSDEGDMPGLEVEDLDYLFGGGKEKDLLAAA